MNINEGWREHVLDDASAETRTETAFRVVAENAPCVKKREAFSMRRANWEGLTGEVMGVEFHFISWDYKTKAMAISGGPMRLCVMASSLQFVGL